MEPKFSPQLYVKPSKSWLILKTPDLLQHAENIFKDYPIKKTTTGKRHLGAALGTDEFKTSYIDEKVLEWCKRLMKLSEIAKTQPHAAYAAYIHGEQHRYTYFVRTIPNIAENLQPLDDVINNHFIPALFGNDITTNEREILSLPIKEGGMGLRWVNKHSEQAYETSKSITKPLVRQIIDQSDLLPDASEVSETKITTTQELRNQQKRHLEAVIDTQSSEMKRTMEQLAEPGASSWLASLPLETYQFNLTKAEFHDALCLRYQKRLKNLPSHCPCGAPFDVKHALNCHKGGFVNMRHDNIRDFECSLLKSVTHDVENEPNLHPNTQQRKLPTISCNSR